MGIDYSPYLFVAEDGEIWWPVETALANGPKPDGHRFMAWWRRWTDGSTRISTSYLRRSVGALNTIGRERRTLREQ